MIEAGANGISNAAIQVSDSPALPGVAAARPGTTSVVCAANITVLQPGTPISTTTLGCAATGRYMTLTADQPMDLCRWVLCSRESIHDLAAFCRAACGPQKRWQVVPHPVLTKDCLFASAACLSTPLRLMQPGTSPTVPQVTWGRR